MRLHLHCGRHAFTLLEVLVALIVLAVGILGLSASSALVSRLLGDTSRLTIAATVATARLERLRGGSCAGAVPGSAVTRGIEERWTVAPMGQAPGAALEVQITVAYRLRTRGSASARRVQRFRGAVPCNGA